MVSDLEAERYLALVDKLGERYSKRRGWMSAVAKQLGLHRSTLTKLLRGERQVTRGMLQRAGMTWGHRLAPATDLVERAVRSAGLGRPKAPRWTHVVAMLAVGSTSAHDLCRHFGVDPDEELGEVYATWACSRCEEDAEPGGFPDGWVFADVNQDSVPLCGVCFAHLDGDECDASAVRDCPHDEPLHYHHDGCPSCS